MAESVEEVRSSLQKLQINYPGSKAGVSYPLTVIYCGECSLPVDLCEYAANPEACKEWLNKNHPNYFATQNPAEGGEAKSAEGDAEKKSHQRRGGKGLLKAKKEKLPSKVIILKEKRKGNKYVTIITGLGTNDIDVEAARKFFAQKFSCGCSKAAEDELIIQGDVVDNLFDVIPEKFPQITEDMIEEKESKHEKVNQ